MVTSICPSHAAPVGDLWGHEFCQVLVGCACPLTGVLPEQAWRPHSFSYISVFCTCQIPQGRFYQTNGGSEVFEALKGSGLTRPEPSASLPHRR